MSPAEIVHRPAKKATKPAKSTKSVKKAKPRAKVAEKKVNEPVVLPPPLQRGQRIQYARRPARDAADPRLRLGFATVEYEWLALDERAVRARLDNGKVVNLFPGFGDKVTLVQ